MKSLDLPVLPTAEASNRRPALLRRALRLEYISISWNVLEGIVAIAAGVAAGSVALVGFGVDSFVETTSSVVIIWRVFAERRNRDPERVEAVERLAQKLVAASLLLLAGYVAFESATALAYREEPDPSLVGIILAVGSLSVMLWISRATRKVGRELHSHAIEADSSQTLACWWMSLFLLIGLGLNALFGWWWADPVAALGITAFLLREAWGAWQGKACCQI